MSKQIDGVSRNHVFLCIFGSYETPDPEILEILYILEILEILYDPEILSGKRDASDLENRLHTQKIVCAPFF